MLAPRLDAVVLAAGGNHGRLRAVSGEPFEALIPIGGRPMIAYVVGAVATARRVERILVVGPEAVVAAARAGAPAPERIRGIPAGSTLLGNVERGLEAASGSHALIVTGDVPLLEGHMLDDFVRRCEQSPEIQDVWYSVVERRLGERRYPGVRRTWVRLADGSFTGGNLFLVGRDIVERTRATLGKAIEGRKSPLALARLLGLAATLKFLVGTLSIDDAERRVSHMLGIKGKTVVTPFAEIGIDVDKPADLELATRFLARAATAGAGA